MKVSVLMTTYNHEKFIAKALDSVLMQKTNFPYEIVVGEDCSTDNTRNILLSYRDRFPEKFKLLLNERNLGGMQNGRQTLEACTGEYITSLDGDDFWTCADKLQRQVDFLDSHPECSICFHDVLIVHADGSKEPMHYRPSQKPISTVEDLLLDNYIPTSAVMFRNGLFGKVPEWIDSLKIADWPIHILNALQGNIGYIDEVMSHYMVHRGGIWSMTEWQFRELALIELFEALDRHLPRKYSRITHRLLRWKYVWVSEAYERVENLPCAKQYLIKAIKMHLSLIGHPWRSRLEPGIMASMTDEVRLIGSRKLLKSAVRLYAIPVATRYGSTLLKSRAPRVYAFLKERALRTFQI